MIINQKVFDKLFLYVKNVHLFSIARRKFSLIEIDLLIKIDLNFDFEKLKFIKNQMQFSDKNLILKRLLIQN